MSVIDDFVENNRRYATDHHSELPLKPAKEVTVITCMDSRINVFDMLGLEDGQAHIIRNAGAIVTEDVERSLAISQHLLGTREVILISHTNCGMVTFTDDEFAERMERDAGARPAWPALAFNPVEENVRAGLAKVRQSAFLQNSTFVRGFVFDVVSGRLTEVTEDNTSHGE